jgi:hypothetical protein
MLNEFDYNPLCVCGISNFKGLEIETMENYRTLRINKVLVLYSCRTQDLKSYLNLEGGAQVQFECFKEGNKRFTAFFCVWDRGLDFVSKFSVYQI